MSDDDEISVVSEDVGDEETALGGEECSKGSGVDERSDANDSV